MGKVFYYDNRIFRGIYRDKTDEFQAILELGILDELAELGYTPKVWLTDYQTESFPLILEVEKIKDVSYIFEWTYHMLLDVAELVLNINECLEKYDYCLYDAHSYNVLFDGTKPIWIDIGSIVKRKTRNSFAHVYEEYQLYYDFFSKLMRKSGSISKIILRQTPYFPKYRFLFMLSYGVMSSMLRYYALRIVYMLESRMCVFWQNRVHNLGIYHRRLRRYYKKQLPKQDWSGYQTLQKDILDIPSKVLAKGVFKRYSRVLEILESLKVSSVYEWGGNSGFFSVIACREISSINHYICTDYEDYSVDQLYLFLRANKQEYRYLNKISPLVQDFRDAVLSKELNASLRLNAECEIAMALTHHLLLSQGINIDLMFEAFSLFTTRYIIVEFMPLGLYSGGDDYPPIPSGYNLDWFLEHMGRYFNVSMVEQLEKNRIIVVGKKICSSIGDLQ